MKPLYLLVGIFLSQFACGQSVVTVTQDFGYRVLGQELNVFIDSSGTMTFDEVLTESFHTVQEKRPNLGFSKGAVWVKVAIQNLRSNPLIKFQINQPQLDTVEIFVWDGRELIASYRMGQAYPFSFREFEKPNFLIGLEIPQGQTRWVYTRIATKEQIVLPVYVATPEGMSKMERTILLLFGAYFGLILALAVYNLFVFFTVGDRSYLYYVVYILAVGSTQAVLEGFFDQYLWPDNSWLAMRSVYFFTVIVSVSSLVFMRQFLKTAVYAPTYHRVANLFFAFFGVIFVMTLFGVGPFIHIASQMAIGMVAIYIFATSLAVYRRGYTPAKFFLIAWLVLLVGIIVYALKDAGLIPSTPLTNYLLQVGSAVEAVVLSLALADRINILKREKSESQERALRVSMENERIVKEQNIVLENKVKERTADLEQSNERLNHALENLKATQSQLVDAEKMASLGQLSAGIAHEINNPINFVGANIEPLHLDIQDVLKVLNGYESITSADEFEREKSRIEDLKKELDLEFVLKEIDDLLKGIRHGAERTAAIVAGLKNFSRLDESELQPFDLNQGLESTLLILSNEIPHWVTMDVQLADIPKVECLGGKINQVFLNIINNGLQAFSSWHQKEDRVFKIRSWADGDRVYFRFEDNAGGMSLETRNKIFDPFYTTKEVGQGTGLGMSISYKIIRSHNGDIEIESELGRGSVITLNLPVEGNLAHGD